MVSGFDLSQKHGQPKKVLQSDKYRIFVELITSLKFFQNNKYVKFFLVYPTDSEKNRIDYIYDSISQICNVSMKSITDPHFLASVQRFIQIIASATDLIEDSGTSNPTDAIVPKKTTGKSEVFMDLSMAVHIFEIA